MTRKWTAACLKPLLDKHGHRDIRLLNIDDIEEYRGDLCEQFAPKTALIYLAATKRLVRYSAFKGWRTPLEHVVHSCPPTTAPKPKHLTLSMNSRRCMSLAKVKKSYAGQDGIMLYNALRLQLM